MGRTVYVVQWVTPEGKRKSRVAVNKRKALDLASAKGGKVVKAERGPAALERRFNERK